MKQPAAKQTHLAVGLMMSTNSDLLTFAFLSTRGDQIVSVQNVNRQVFMYTAMGYYPGIVNMNRENLFTKNGVDSCFLVKDDFNRISNYYAPALDSLWKLRYREHPFTYDQYGWSSEPYKPAYNQMVYLDSVYGIKNVLTDYIYGEDLYHLLRDITRSDWISHYKSLP